MRPALQLHEGGLLERQQFLDQLEAHAREAASGSGRLVVVAGEAGIGKTSLVDAFRGRRPDMRWLWGACDGGFTPRPLGPLYDIATTAGGRLRELCTAEADRNAVFAAFTALLAESGPVGVVVEDLHWADEATLDWLSYVSRRLVDLPALVLTTSRDDEPGDDGLLADVMGRLASHRSTRRITLPSLTPDAVRRVADGQDADELHRLTGGNPFYLGEVRAWGRPAGPAWGADGAGARLRRHSPPAQRILAAAAILGRPAPATLLAEIAGVSPAAIDECCVSGALLADGQDFVFRHELTRRAVEEGLPRVQAAELHRIALLALARERTHVAELTHHAVGAADVAAVLRYAPQAGRAAADASAHREAIIHFRRALAHADQLTSTEHADLEEALSESLFVRDQWAEAERHWRRTIELRRALGDPVALSRCLRRYGVCLTRLCRAEESRVVETEAYELMRDADDCVERAIVFYVRGVSEYLALDDRREGVDECARIGKDLGDDALVGKALLAGAFLESRSGAVDFGALEKALVQGKRSGEAWLTACTYANIQWAKVDQLRFDLLPDAYPEGLAYCLDHEQHAFGLYLQGSRAMELMRRGANDEAIDLALACLQTTVSPLIRMHVMMALVRAAFRLGRPEARAWLEETWGLGHGTDETSWLVRIATCAAEASWLTADPTLVDDRVHEAYRGGVGADPWRHGELTAWIQRLGHEVDHARALEPPYSLEVAGEYAVAAQAWREIGCPFEEAVALLWTGDLDAMRRALNLFVGVSSAPGAARARRVLQQHGVRVQAPRGPRASTVAHPAGLTAREAEVLAALRDGLTNTQIAQRLFLSTRTVDHHVSAILAKLGVSTRAEAARRAEALNT